MAAYFYPYPAGRRFLQRQGSATWSFNQVGFPRKYSIRTSSEIKRVIENGIQFKAGSLKIHLLQTHSKWPNRSAFSVPRYGRTIVARNRLRRRLQELVRLYPIQSRGCLTVVRVSPTCYENTFRELEKKYCSLVEKINLDLAGCRVTASQAN